MKHYRDVFGYYRSNLEIDTLAFLAKEKENCLEIGSYIGKSSIAIAANAKRLLCIDTFKAIADKCDKNGNLLQKGNCLRVFLENTKGYTNIRYMIGRSENIVPNLDETFDLVFIDGNHSYKGVKRDIRNCWPKIRVGGVIILHDYFEEKEAIDDNERKRVIGVGRAFRRTLHSYTGRQDSLIWKVKKEG